MFPIFFFNHNKEFNVNLSWHDLINLHCKVVSVYLKISGGAAEKAGLHAGDKIIKVS